MKEKLYPLVYRKGDDSGKPINFCSEFSSTLLVPFAVLGTPTKGYQKSGMVWFAILIPFTTSDNGNGHSCEMYGTLPKCTTQWKQAIILYICLYVF